jgi:hypothetical protein
MSENEDDHGRINQYDFLVSGGGGIGSPHPMYSCFAGDNTVKTS